jgi:transposase
MVQSESTKLDFSGQHVFVGLDVARKSWKASIMVGADMPHRTFTQPPDAAVLVQYLHRNFPNAAYHCVYEAGFTGFWTHRALTERGIDCVVVNPADVPTTNKEHQTKTDRVDAQKLARTLANGDLHSVYVPSREAQEDRSLTRLRTAYVRKQTRCKNQIKMLLYYYGIECRDPESSIHHWSRPYITWIQSLTLEHRSGTIALQTLLAELLALRATLLQLTRSIRSLAETERYRRQVELLRTIPGISLLSGMTLLTELITIDRFGDLDHLASYTGLVPGERSTGDTQVVTGITRRQNKGLRAMLVECAWVAVRQDPALLMNFAKLSSRMPKQQAIVRIAHKLLNRIRAVLRSGSPYELRTV